MISAVNAIREGRVEDLQKWLATHVDRVNDVVGDNPRTLLHYATDWPGHSPRVAETIAALAAAGADVNAQYDRPESGP